MKKNYEKPTAIVVSFQSNEELMIGGSMSVEDRPTGQSILGPLEDKSDFQLGQ